MIEDTTFVIDVMSGDENALVRLDSLETQRVPEKLSAISVLELFEGIFHVDHLEEERELIADVIGSKTIVAADHDIMRTAGELSETLRSSGKEIDREDCIIAATALQESEPVLTRNSDHFHRVDNLSVETY